MINSVPDTMTDTAELSRILDTLCDGYRHLFFVELLTRELIRALANRAALPVQELCKGVHANGRSPSVPVDVRREDTIDALDTCTLPQLVAVLFGRDLRDVLAEAIAPKSPASLRSRLQALTDTRNAVAHYWRLPEDERIFGLATHTAEVLIELLSNLDDSDSTVRALSELHLSRQTPKQGRVRLDFARQGTPDPAVTNAVAFHASEPSAETEAILEIPSRLSQLFGLRQTFGFRANTTQGLHAALAATAQHILWHRSRPGEEPADAARLIGLRPSLRVSAGKLVITDCEHPAVAQMARVTWPRGTDRIVEIALADLLWRKTAPSNAHDMVVERYREAAKDTDVQAVVVPHVVWFNGATLDVARICREIKSVAPLVTTIVDGAQASGHVPIGVEHPSQENTDIDFYLASGHKWLCGPEAVGFLRIGQRFRPGSGCEECGRSLAAGDVLTDSTAIGLQQSAAQVGTQHRGLARGFNACLSAIQNEPGTLETAYASIRRNADAIRSMLGVCDALVSLDPPDTMRSGIVAVGTPRGASRPLALLRDALASSGFVPAYYGLPWCFRGYDMEPEFLRLSPGPGLSEFDLDAIEAIIRGATG